MKKPNLARSFLVALALCAYAVSLVTVFGSGFAGLPSPVSGQQLCLAGNDGRFVTFDGSTGDYVYYCEGSPVASGRGALTRRGSFGRIIHQKGARTVWIQWDLASGGGVGAGYAFIVHVGSGVRCSITDTDMKNNGNCGQGL